MSFLLLTVDLLSATKNVRKLSNNDDASCYKKDTIFK